MTAATFPGLGLPDQNGPFLSEMGRSVALPPHAS